MIDEQLVVGKLVVNLFLSVVAKVVSEGNQKHVTTVELSLLAVLVS